MQPIHPTFLQCPYCHPCVLSFQAHAVQKVLAVWLLCSYMQRRGTSLPDLRSPSPPSTQTCANQSYPKGGFEKSVVGCCNAFPPLCIHYGGQHASFHRTGPVRCEILASLCLPWDQDIPNAPDVGPPQTTPQCPTAAPTVLANPARHGPCFPPSSESTQPENIKLVRSRSAQPNLTALLPCRNLLGAGSTLFWASTSAN